MYLLTSFIISTATMMQNLINPRTQTPVSELLSPQQQQHQQQQQSPQHQHPQPGIPQQLSPPGNMSSSQPPPQQQHQMQYFNG